MRQGMRQAIVTWAGLPPHSAPQTLTAEADVEGLWQDVAGMSWQAAEGNPACLIYAVRNAESGLPLDNNVYYVKVGAFGHLVHETELEFVDEDA